MSSSMSNPICDGLVSMLQTIQNGAIPLYSFVKKGAIFDPSSISGLWAEVVDPRGRAGHAGSGGNQIGWRIDDLISFKLTTGYLYEADSTAALTNILMARDVLMPILMSHYLIPSPNNPAQAIASVYSVLEDQGQTDITQPVRFPNGHLYLLWSLWVQVKQQYNVELVSP
jgi:hypothetical protein